MADETAKDEQKTERFNMFLSPSEMKAIDDWAWKNKIRSKSEAVRRLCQIGLFVGGEIEGLTDNVIELASALNTIDEQTSNLWLAMASPILPGDSLDREKVAARVEILLSNIAQVAGGLDEVAHVAVALHNATAGFSAAESLAQGKNLSENIVNETNATLGKMRELREKRVENRREMSKYAYRKPQQEGDET